MKALVDILKNSLPILKKTLPFVGVLATNLAAFFLGAKWKSKQCEKRYAKVCEVIKQHEERLRQLEAEKAPQKKSGRKTKS